MPATTGQRHAVKNLLAFIKEVASIRQAKLKNLNDAPWKLNLRELNPDLPGVSAVRPATDPTLLCRIEHLDPPACPVPPEVLEPYLSGEWRRPGSEPVWDDAIRDLRPEDLDEVESRLEEVKAELASTEPLPEDVAVQREEERIRLESLLCLRPALEARGQWVEERAAWTEARKPVDANNRLFEQFMLVRDMVAQSNLRCECVLGNFLFESDPSQTPSVEGKAWYPLIVQSVVFELSTSARKLPQLEVRLNTEETSRFLGDLVQCFTAERIDLSATQDVASYLGSDEAPSPIDSETLYDKMQRMTALLSTACRWREVGEPIQNVEGVKFRITPEPYLLFQERPTGIKEAIDAITADIDEGGDIPKHILEIVCPDVVPVCAPDPDERPTPEAALAATAGEDETILLTKPANTEQLTIAREIMRNNVVLVQGPPGTGKTHTIANLLGHFLAQGQRVLVTSHTAKALTVLKAKLPEAIQPLCVEMIENKKDLVRTTLALKDELSTKHLSQLKLEIEIEELTDARGKIIARQRELRKKLFSLRQSEYKGPVVDGKELPIKDLAAELAAHEELDKVFPGGVTQAVPPLSPEEFEELFGMNGLWTPDEERELAGTLPPLESIPEPQKMREMCEEQARLEALSNTEDDAIESTGRRSNAAGQGFVVYNLRNGVRVALRDDALGVLEDDPGFKLLEQAQNDPLIRRVLSVTLADGEAAAVYADLSEKLLATAKARQTRIRERYARGGLRLTFPETLSPADLLRAAEWFLEHAPSGSIGFGSKLFGLFNAEQKAACAAMENVRLSDRKPGAREDFEFIRDEARYLMEERETADRWNIVAGAAGVPDFASRGEKAPQELADAYAEVLLEASTWFRDVFTPYADRLRKAGLELRGARLLDETGSAEHRLETCIGTLLTVFRPVHDFRRLEKDRQALTDWGEGVRRTLEAFVIGSDEKVTPTARALRDAVLTDPNAWKAAYARLETNLRDQKRFERRHILLDRLRAAAPDWATALENGAPEYARRRPPEALSKVWRWKHMDALYRDWTSESAEDLQKELQLLSRRLRENTAALAAAKAWFATKERLQNSPALQNLQHLALHLQRAQGKGRFAARHRHEANRLLPSCQGAVPVWIMMIQDALLNFNSAAKFDIIIVDEASQADMTAIPILHMGKKVIVVGDDKQVTPLAVGTSGDAFNALVESYLVKHVKAPRLYDSKMSLFGIIETMAFPAHMLKEHFRCVPDIIGFCNQLSYDGEIKPLRDKSSTNLTPSIVTYQVEDAEITKKGNVKEAEAVVNLLQAMVEDPAYEGKTFGIISMRSGRQNHINTLRSLVLNRFDPRVLEERRILCGSSAEFQGDERDVILLSLVDTKEGDEMLVKTGDGHEDSNKKRWNVAVSRARDQLWVVHSFDPNSQLKHDDIRKNLFGWIKACEKGEAHNAEIRRNADSIFEEEVAKALIARGYRIEQQHAVGSYRIDMVVYGNGQAAALECDGDRYHSGDKAIRDDMERQTVLERNGWRFIRLRGSEYFRGKSAAIDRVCRDLAELGVTPDADLSPAASKDDKIVQRILERAARIAKGEVDAPQTYAASVLSSDDADASPATETALRPEDDGATEETCGKSPRDEDDAPTKPDAAPEDEKTDENDADNCVFKIDGGEAFVFEGDENGNVFVIDDEDEEAPGDTPKVFPVPPAGDLSALDPLQGDVVTRADILRSDKPEFRSLMIRLFVDAFETAGLPYTRLVFTGRHLYAVCHASDPTRPAQPAVAFQAHEHGLIVVANVVKGIRARGIPPAEFSEDKTCRYWVFDPSDMEDAHLCGLLAGYLVRVVRES